ncbi:GNAT family N-acetyltransferase [Paenibacillus sp. MMS20-IR301]|uniref:GNAT family N-acetyltransferase n=1 Tax=Paenibacillus sp. MMS20-IR301 TaxID=2895946 RepID=UPI0028F0632C|nr:GNAT family N-acetyltransferase [Paenibacillus sp. MMS20-IR301]WNS45969.1 GNAT family N-acetyltransferase [Paenibacillus sp. MMS20-IR301]
MEVKLIKAQAEDAAAIHAMQTQAFLPLLEKYQDHDTNPANETVERTVERINQAHADKYIISCSGVAVGAVRVTEKENKKYRVGRIFITPEHQGKGIAQQVFALIEQIYADAKSWELDTIMQEARNCYLYEKLGYKRTGETHEINDKLTLCFYEKEA